MSAVDQGSFQMLALMNEKPFGQFILARLKADKGGQFTLKCVSKLKALSENAAKNVMSEYRIAARLVDEHLFVPSLLHTFESPAYLFSLYDTTMAMDLLVSWRLWTIRRGDGSLLCRQHFPCHRPLASERCCLPQCQS